MLTLCKSIIETRSLSWGRIEGLVCRWSMFNGLASTAYERTVMSMIMGKFMTGKGIHLSFSPSMSSSLTLQRDDMDRFVLRLKGISMNE